MLFDTIVIGSSPLLILEALSIREHGKTVAIIEKSKELGGVWHLETTFVDGVKVKHECSCHVIEWYLNGYQLLSELSGHPFEVLETQPVKVYRNGCVRCYSSRIQIALKWFHFLLLYAVSVARASTSIVRSERGKRDLINLQTIRKRLIAQTKFRLLGIWEFVGIKGPRGGFEEFWIALERKREEAGIPVIKGEVISIDESDSDVKAILSDGRHIAAKEIVLGDSVRLSKCQDLTDRIPVS